MQPCCSGRFLVKGNVYLAPSDHLLMIDGAQKIIVTKGATETGRAPKSRWLCG
jgi:hypothetical protein